VIVGIGASAGGVQALQAFFDALPNTDRRRLCSCGAPRSAGLQRPVEHPRGSHEHACRQVGPTEKLQANHVYVIAPDRRLHISDQKILSAEFAEPRGHRAPIDLFFRSLAEQYGDGFAIILTGAGSDGAIGVRAVKEAGGIILVQDPNEADYPSMPQS
jgi:two-component system, chemotaxis family, CheB/CheR fusion protein